MLINNHHVFRSYLTQLHSLPSLYFMTRSDLPPTGTPTPRSRRALYSTISAICRLFYSPHARTTKGLVLFVSILFRAFALHAAPYIALWYNMSIGRRVFIPSFRRIPYLGLEALTRKCPFRPSEHQHNMGGVEAWSVAAA